MPSNLFFFERVMRKEKQEHLVIIGMIEGRRSREKQREKMLDGLTKLTQRRTSDRRTETDEG